MAAGKKTIRGEGREVRRSRRAVQLPRDTSVAEAIRLPRDPKGRRAQFYDDPAIDQLMAIVTALTAEVSVAFDRIDTLERLLERVGSLREADVESFVPDPEAAATRARRREELIQRVFQVLSRYPGRD
jgi:hypothetical protein